MSGGRRVAVGAGIAAAAGAACFAYGVVIERHLFTVRRFTLPVLPAGSPTLRVLHISDIHLVERQHRKLQFVSRLQGLEPDLVVNTGDNISQAEAITPLVRALGRLLKCPGVFVFGSNDYAEPTFRNPLKYLVRSTHGATQPHRPLPTSRLRSSFTDAGWIDLNNARATLTVHGVRLDLRGTNDAHHDLDDLTVVQGSQEPNTDLLLGVTHAPYQRVLNAFTSAGAGLILAGHTHGGQVCLPGFGAVITNCDLDRARAKGVSRHRLDGQESTLHVSAGIGGSYYAPYRFACRPEASLLTLTANDAEHEPTAVLS